MRGGEAEGLVEVLASGLVEEEEEEEVVGCEGEGFGDFVGDGIGGGGVSGAWGRVEEGGGHGGVRGTLLLRG